MVSKAKTQAKNISIELPHRIPGNLQPLHPEGEGARDHDAGVSKLPHAPLRERKIRDERAPAIGVQQCHVRLHVPWNGNCHFNVTGLGGEDT